MDQYYQFLSFFTFSILFLKSIVWTYLQKRIKYKKDIHYLAFYFSFGETTKAKKEII